MSASLIIDKLPTYWAFKLNRADKLNALSSELVEALIEAFDEAEREGVPLITLSGEGRCFSAGFDMNEVSRQSHGDLLLRFVRIETLLNRIASSSCFTLGFAHGRNFGAGVDLIGACNLRAAAPGTTFRMPGLKFGLVLGTARFARLVGNQEARRILESASSFDMDRALHNGFVERQLAPEALPQLIIETQTRINELPRESRELLRQALDTEQADADMAALVRSAAAPGLHERIQSYLSAPR